MPMIVKTIVKMSLSNLATDVKTLTLSPYLAPPDLQQYRPPDITHSDHDYSYDCDFDCRPVTRL